MNFKSGDVWCVFARLSVCVVAGNHMLINVLEEPKLNFWSSQAVLQTKHRGREKKKEEEKSRKGKKDDGCLQFVSK